MADEIGDLDDYDSDWMRFGDLDKEMEDMMIDEEDDELLFGNSD